MSITEQLSKTPGVARITEMFHANLTRRPQLTAGLQTGNCQSNAELPLHFRRLQQQMTANTERCLFQDTRYMIHQLFSLSELQFRTPPEIGVSDSDIRTLQTLNFLLPHHENYAVNQRLKIIAATPAFPPDWKDWWFRYRNSFIGIHRPQDHDPVKDPASENLNRIIAAIAAAALPHLPAIRQITHQLTAEPDRQGEAVRLSDIYTCASQLVHWGEGIGIPAKDTPYYDLRPEFIAATLQEAGTDYQADMGTFGTATELRQVLLASGLGGIRASARARVWRTKERTATGFPYPGRNTIRGAPASNPMPKSNCPGPSTS